MNICPQLTRLEVFRGRGHRGTGGSHFCIDVTVAAAAAAVAVCGAAGEGGGAGGAARRREAKLLCEPARRQLHTRGIASLPDISRALPRVATLPSVA